MDGKKRERLAKNLRIDAFIRDLTSCPLVIDEFDERFWVAAVGSVMVRRMDGWYFGSRIFEKLGQVASTRTRQAEGYGIGLHLVKLLVALLGGKITLDSVVGSGSTFTIFAQAHCFRSFEFYPFWKMLSIHEAKIGTSFQALSF